MRPTNALLPQLLDHPLPHTCKAAIARFNKPALQALYLLACKSADSARSYKNTDFSTFSGNFQLFDRENDFQKKLLLKLTSRQDYKKMATIKSWPSGQVTLL